MARKSKGKFKMQSPLHQTPEVPTSKLEHGNVFTKGEIGKYDEDYLSRTKLKGETNAQYLIRQLARIKKAKKDKEENRSKEFNEQRDSYDSAAIAKQYDVAPEDMIQDASGNWVPKEGAKGLTHGDTWSEGGWKDDATTRSEVTTDIPIVEDKEVTPPQPPPSTSYEVVKDDSLSKIAAANNTTVQALMEANPHIKDKDKIYPGNKIIIPGSTSEFEDTDEEFSVYKDEEDKKTWEGDDLPTFF